jgi:hypothetical protein
MSQWLNAEALAQYIMGAISAVLVILGWWLFRRKRARYVQIEDFGRVSFIWIDSAFRERITVVLDKETGGGEQIDTLSQLRVKIRNTTRETIENVTLRLLFKPTGARFLYVELDPPEDMQWQEAPPYYQLESESRICVSLPYLKSSEVYGAEQAATLTILADGDPQIAKVVGGGRDWSARYISHEERAKQRQLYLRLVAVINLLVIFAFPILAFAFYSYLFSWRLGLHFIGGFIAASVVGFITSRILWMLGRATAMA